MINQRLYHYTYYLWGYFLEHQDPRTKNYPLVSLSPYSIALIMYFYYLLVTKIGRKFMKNRQPFQLRKTMFIYNIFMVIINAYFFYEAISYCDYLRVFLNFDYPDSSDRSPETIRVSFNFLFCNSKQTVNFFSVKTMINFFRFCFCFTL